MNPYTLKYQQMSDLSFFKFYYQNNTILYWKKFFKKYKIQ